MKIIKQQKLRRISFTYKELSKLLRIPKGEFMMGVFGNEIQFWKNDKSNLSSWEIVGSIEEIGEKIGLLKGEVITSDDYWVFTGYHLIVKTNNDNLNKIKLNLPKRIFFKLNPKDLKFERWRKMRGLFANGVNGGKK